MATKKLYFYLSNQHNLIVKLLIFFISVSLMVSVMPVEGKFRYSYEKGKVWLHDDYVAPFDFAIQKSAEDIQGEKEQLSKQSKAYYQFDDQVVFIKQRDLAQELDTFIQRVTGVNADEYLPARNDRMRILKEGQTWLAELYDRGVLQNSLETKSGGKLVVQIRDHIAEEKDIASYYTKTTALEFISQKLYRSNQWKDPELKLFFEKYITPNVLFSDELSA